jgi:hypothetical protein
MLRTFLSWILTIAIAIPSWGLTDPQTKLVNGYLKDAGFGTSQISVKEFYRKFGRDFPVDAQREMEIFLKQYPNAKFPESKVAKLTEGSAEIVQITFTSGSDTVVLRINPASQQARVTGTQRGQKYDLKISSFELQNPARLMAAISGVEPWTERYPTIQVLSPEEVKKLGEQDRKNYIDRLREVLAAAEKAQNAFNSGKKTSDLRDYLWELLSEPAWAGAPSGECIVAGWVGSYQNGTCVPPSQARAGGCTRCNSDIYGEGSECVGPASGKLPLNATEICNQKTESNKYAVFKGVKTAADVDAKKQSLSGVLTGLTEKCGQIESGVSQGTKLGDQADACANLKSRIGELNQVNCDILAQDQNKGNFPDLRCRATPPPSPEPPPVTDRPTRPVNRPGSGECVNLPLNRGELKCSAGELREMECEEDGQKQTKFYCECASGSVGEKKNTVLDVGCSARQTASTTTTPSKSTKSKKEESWFKPWMGVALAVAAGLGLMWLFMKGTKETMKSQYDLLAPTPTATPVPPPVSPSAPLPTDVNRPPPGTR